MPGRPRAPPGRPEPRPTASALPLPSESPAAEAVDAPSDPERTELLLARIEAGDAAARERLFTRMHATVLALVRRRAGRRVGARYTDEDLAQSVLAEVVGGLERFEYQGDGALTRWLARRVENKIRQRARGLEHGDRDPARVAPLVNAGADSAEVGVREPAGDQETPSVEVRRNEERERLEATIARLPEREARLVRLRDLEEREWDAIVELAGESTKKAAQQCHARAWARLAGMLLDDES